MIFNVVLRQVVIRGNKVHFLSPCKVVHGVRELHRHEVGGYGVDLVVFFDDVTLGLE